MELVCAVTCQAATAALYKGTREDELSVRGALSPLDYYVILRIDIALLLGIIARSNDCFAEVVEAA